MGDAGGEIVNAYLLEQEITVVHFVDEDVEHFGDGTVGGMEDAPAVVNIGGIFKIVEGAAFGIDENELESFGGVGGDEASDGAAQPFAFP